MPSVVVVGAGMAGSTAARALQEAGWRVTVVDKGRAVGGRMATRRIGDATFDHGAQHVSARNDAFRERMDDWVRAGVARVWMETPSRTRRDGAVEPRHVGVGGMRRIPEHLARGLDVRTGVRITFLETSADGITAVADDGARFAADALVLTPPLPQLVPLLDGLGVDAGMVDRLGGVRYDPCLAVMATLDGPAGLDGGHHAGDGDVAWIADNHHKGVSAIPAVTIHSSAPFAARHIDDPDEAWVEHLVDAARPLLAADVASATGHRWRYSMPVDPLDDGAVALLRDPPVVAAGEAFAGARVEGAFLSGRAAARLLRSGPGTLVEDTAAP